MARRRKSVDSLLSQLSRIKSNAYSGNGATDATTQRRVARAEQAYARYARNIENHQQRRYAQQSERYLAQSRQLQAQGNTKQARELLKKVFSTRTKTYTNAVSRRVYMGLSAG